MDSPNRHRPAALRGILAGGRPLLWLVLAALLVRLLALWAAADAQPVMDERRYLLHAEALLDGQGFLGSWQSFIRQPNPASTDEPPQYLGSFQPPLYTAFVAAVLGVTGRSVLAVKLAQSILSALTVALVYGLGRAWFDHRRGLYAAAVCAFYPDLIAFSHYLFTETLFTFLVVAVFLLLTGSTAVPSRGAAALAGVLTGLGGLTRAAVVYFVPPLVGWLAWTHADRLREVARRAALLLALCALVIAPWSVRSSLLHGGLVLLDTNGSFNLWRGNAPQTFASREKCLGDCYPPPFDHIPVMPVAAAAPSVLVHECQADLGREQLTDLEIVACAGRLARQNIARDPAAFVARAWIKIVDLWNPTSFLMRQIKLGAYGPVRPWIESGISWIAVVAYLFVAAGAIAGFVFARRKPETWLVFTLLVCATGVHAVTFGLTRFRLPLIPFLAVLAGHALATVRESFSARRGSPGS